MVTPQMHALRFRTLAFLVRCSHALTISVTVPSSASWGPGAITGAIVMFVLASWLGGMWVMTFCKPAKSLVIGRPGRVMVRGGVEIIICLGVMPKEAVLEPGPEIEEVMQAVILSIHVGGAVFGCKGRQGT